MNSQSAAAFNNRLETLEPKIRKAARAAVGTLSEYDADDLYQTAVLKLWERAQTDPTFVNRSDAELVTFATWRARHKATQGRIYTKYVDNEVLFSSEDDDNELSNFDLIPSSDKSPEDACIAAEELNSLQTAIKALPPRQREFAILLYQGYTQSEAAAKMGIHKVTAHEMKVAISKRLIGLVQ